MLKCSHCQWENHDAAQFCANCGNRLTAADLARSVPPTPQAAGPAPDAWPTQQPQAADWAVAVEEKNAAAMRLVAEGKLAEALEALNEAIRLVPNHAPSYLNRADVLARLGMMSQAEADRRMAHQLAPATRPPMAPVAGTSACPSCGRLAPANARFCPECAQEIGGPAYAGFWQRFGALFLDGIITMAISLIPAIIIGIIVYEATLPDGAFVTQQEEDEAITAGFWGGYLVWVIISAVYRWLGDSLGGTWGKRALGLRVVSAADSGNIGLLRGLGRYIVAGIGSIPLYLGWFWMLWDDQKQTWHDKAAGSIVVRKR